MMMSRRPPIDTDFFFSFSSCPFLSWSLTLNLRWRLPADVTQVAGFTRLEHEILESDTAELTPVAIHIALVAQAGYQLVDAKPAFAVGTGIGERAGQRVIAGRDYQLGVGCQPYRSGVSAGQHLLFFERIAVLVDDPPGHRRPWLQPHGVRRFAVARASRKPISFRSFFK